MRPGEWASEKEKDYPSLMASATYRLDLPPHMQLHDVFHVEKLSPCIENKTYRTHPEPPPVKVEGELEYKVDSILDSKINRRVKGGICYLV